MSMSFPGPRFPRERFARVLLAGLLLWGLAACQTSPPPPEMPVPPISVPAEPIAFLSVDCRLARVVDLREAAVQRLLETNEAELCAPLAHDAGGPTPMQALGAMLVEAGQSVEGGEGLFELE